MYHLGFVILFLIGLFCVFLFVVNSAMKYMLKCLNKFTHFSDFKMNIQTTLYLMCKITDIKLQNIMNEWMFNDNPA